MRALLVATTLFAIPTLSYAEQYGDQGTIQLFGSISGGAIQTTPPDGEGTTGATSSFSPGALFFVTNGFAIGGQIRTSMYMGDVTSDSSSTTYGFGLAPMIAFNIPFGGLVSMLILGSIGVDTQRSSYGDRDSSSYNANVGVNVPFLFHFGNFFFGVGPTLTIELLSKQTNAEGTTTDGYRSAFFGFSTTIGGWL